jgi:hypothetical protein
MTIVVLTASQSSSLPPIILNNGFAASLTASGKAAAIITGRRSLPIRFTGGCV